MKQLSKLFERKDLTNSAWLQKHMKYDPVESAMLNDMFRIKETSKSDDDFQTRLRQVCLIYEQFIIDTILAKASGLDEGMPYFEDVNKRADLVPAFYDMAEKEPFSRFCAFARKHIPDFSNLIIQARKDFRDGAFLDYDIYPKVVYRIPGNVRAMGYVYTCNPLVLPEWHKK